MARDKADRVDEILAEFRKAKASERRIPALAELVEAIFTEMGGPRKFAQELMATLKDASGKGGNKMVRIKVLDLCTLLVKEHGRQQKGAERPPVEILNDDDLRDTGRKLILTLIEQDQDFRAEVARIIAREGTDANEEAPPRPTPGDGGRDA